MTIAIYSLIICLFSFFAGWCVGSEQGYQESKKLADWEPMEGYDVEWKK